VSYPGTRGECPCWMPERHQRGIDNCISSCGISLGFSCFSQLGSHGLFDSPARLRNETKSFVDHLESHTVLACNSHQVSELEVGRKGMDGYLLVWWRCCVQKKFKVIFPCKKWKGVSNWNAFTAANFRQRNRNPGTSCIFWVASRRSRPGSTAAARWARRPGKKPCKEMYYIDYKA